ncbi:MAG: BlaI/MecI/CopY family transcriptional regulator [Vicingaceae bacterium]
MDKNKLRELTRAEEEVMQVLWKINTGFVRDILAHFEDPKPAYNTVSTIVRILQDKGFVGHEAFGKSHQYFPLVSKSQYSKFQLRNLMSDYFSGSFKNLVSFMAEEEDLSIRDIEELKRLVDNHKRKS